MAINQSIRKATSRVKSVHDATSDKLFRVIQKARQENNYATIGKQRALLKTISSILATYREDVHDIIMDGVYEVSLQSEKSLVGGNGAPESTIVKHVLAHSDEMLGMYLDNYIMRVKIDMKKLLQMDFIAIQRKASFDGTSKGDAQRALLPEILANEPKMLFMDSAGRKWLGSNYLWILTNTTLVSASLDTFLGVAADRGITLARLSDSDSGYSCDKLSGMTVSLTEGGEHPYIGEFLRGGSREGELFHPRCSHYLIPYEA